MKSVSTKFQELVAEFFGRGVYVVEEADLPKLSQFFEGVFSRTLEEKYTVAFMKYLRGEQTSAYERQLKYYAMTTLRILACSIEAPEFLKKVEYPEDKMWGLVDLAEPLFGRRGDPKVYRASLPAPANGGEYTTQEVKAIVKNYDG